MQSRIEELPVPDSMYAETDRLAMETAFNANAQSLRNHGDLDEAKLLDTKKRFSEAIVGGVCSSDIEVVCRAVTAGLTRSTVTQEQADEQLRRSEADRVETIAAIHAKYGPDGDKVWAKTKEMVRARPALLELLKEAGLDNNPTVFLAVARRAKVELQRAGQL